MTPTEESVLKGAIYAGERHADLAIKHAFRERDLRRAMWKAYHQLKVGKTSEAAETIQKALAK